MYSLKSKKIKNMKFYKSPRKSKSIKIIKSYI